MIGEADHYSLYHRGSSLKERDVKHLRIDDVKKLYDIFEFKEEIGHGTFGIVVGAIEKSTSNQYAIKIVNKFSTGAAKMNEVKTEIKILKTVLHPNIINLDKIYESTKKIYLIYGGYRFVGWDNKYRQENPFTEKVSRKIIKQLVSAVYYLHKHDIVHRDIKMENILMATNVEDSTDNYFIKLSDFGLSVFKTGAGIEGMLKDRVGTIIYMAPEILLSHTYSELCDVWSIGVILYMLLFGNYPFFAPERDALMLKICESEPEYIQKVNSDCLDLMKSILVKDPAKRVTALEILKHPWLVDNKIKSRKDETIIDYMKKWRSEMMLPGEESDWMSTITDFDEMSIRGRGASFKSTPTTEEELSQVSTGLFSQYSAISGVGNKVLPSPKDHTK